MEEALVQQIRDQLAQRLPFVLYAAPNSGEGTALFQQIRSTETTTSNSEQFVFHPFSGNKELVIDKDNSLSLHFATPFYTVPTTSFQPPNDPLEHGRYTSLVQQALSRIQESKTSKIVLSRVASFSLNEMNAPTIFERLMVLYPTAFRYLWYHPESGIWCGATPEVLLKANGTAFETMALAGTKRIEKGQEVKWTRKEINEQQWVTDDLTAKLESVTSVLKVHKTKNHQAGTLMHLRTDFTGILKKGDHQLEVLISKLHPTPAVCGTPTSNAQQFIAQHEGYDRQYYTGYLGWLNANSKEAELYVNLRCMRLDDSKASLYVGGGIVEDSEPEEEWEETQYKLQTMLQVIGPWLKK